MAWWDFYQIFQRAFEPDPITKRNKRSLQGIGLIQPTSPRRTGNEQWDNGMLAGRYFNELIDINSVNSRQNRYIEYEKIVNSIPEVEMVISVFADEACIAGDTPVATVAHGFQTIEWLAENKKDERFLVYCWDETKQDYTLGWAFDPRLVKNSPTVRIIFDDGSMLVCTPDHKVLTRDNKWKEAGTLRQGDELIPFYRIEPNKNLNKLKVQQFPRIFTFSDGWKNEKQFIEEWKLGTSSERLATVYKTCKMIAAGMTCRQIANLSNHTWATLVSHFRAEGFTFKEVRLLGKKRDSRRVIGVQPWKEVAVYDLSVEEHKNFCTDCCVVHNCQKDEEGNVVNIKVKNPKVKKELNRLFFNRNHINLNRNLQDWYKQLFIKGDLFIELIIDPDEPKDGLFNALAIPPERMFRIETPKGRLIEFQQSDTQPNYDIIDKYPIETATIQELSVPGLERFSSHQMVHIRLGEGRKDFYPYGMSLIEPARGAAYQLKMMEDAMLVYRLTRAPERRVFYIDQGTMPQSRADALLERLKQKLRKKKVGLNRGKGLNQMEERWAPMPFDEDIWLGVRPNSNTRIDTLPGATNLNEIDDVLYFRNKLFVAMKFPKNYLASEDVTSTRITLSAQDVKFAKRVEHLQGYVEDGLYEIAIRHLVLMGFPEELYEDLKITATPPSAWKELSEAEVKSNRINNATAMKGSLLMADYDIYVEILKTDPDKAEEMIARNKLQKIEELKLQLIATNPISIGLGLPGGNEQEIGTEVGGPNPMLAPPPPEEGGAAPPAGQQQQPGLPPQENEQPSQVLNNPRPIPKASKEDIKKYNLEIEDYESGQDNEDVDFSEL